MNNFYERCVNLRGTYLKNDSISKLSILSKLISIAFYNNSHCFDKLPEAFTLSINCTDVGLSTYEELEKVLKEVLEDLGYQSVFVFSDYFYSTRVLEFSIN